MNYKHAKELQEFGSQIDVLVTIREKSLGIYYVTFRDFEVYDFVKGVTLLRQIQETELPQETSGLVY